MLHFNLPIYVHDLIPDKVKLQQNYPTVLLLPAVAEAFIASVHKHVVVGSSKVGGGFDTIISQ